MPKVRTHRLKINRRHLFFNTHDSISHPGTEQRKRSLCKDQLLSQEPSIHFPRRLMGNLLSSVSLEKMSVVPGSSPNTFLVLSLRFHLESLDSCPMGPFFHRPQAANRRSEGSTLLTSPRIVYHFGFFELVSSTPHFSTSSILTCFLKKRRTVDTTMRNNRMDPRSTQ